MLGLRARATSAGGPGIEPQVICQAIISTALGILREINYDYFSVRLPVHVLICFLGAL